MRQIVVCTAGWVVMGTVAPHSKTQGDVLLTDASVVRRWGTTRGLGQLAIEGATKDTVLDPCGTVAIPAGSVVMRIDCAD